MDIRENKCLKAIKVLNLRKEDTLQAIGDEKRGNFALVVMTESS